MSDINAYRARRPMNIVTSTTDRRNRAMVSAKRKREDGELDVATPSKLRARAQLQDEADGDATGAETPSRKTRSQQVADNGTPRSILKKSGGPSNINGTPKSNRKLVFNTPSKPTNGESRNGTPAITRNADHSARRKSNRRLLERTINGDEGDDDVLEEEEMLAQQILSDEDGAGEGAGEAGKELDAVHVDSAPLPETPTKRKRGRPKGSGKSPGRPRKQRSPTPPQDQNLPPHEEYFWQNRPGGTKTSNNTLSSQTLLNHDEYFHATQSHQGSHEAEREFLLELHSRAYDQWLFELDQGFNICLYGYGSKRPITQAFSAHLYHSLTEQSPYKGTKRTPKIVVINGYTPGTTIKDILSTVASAIFPSNTKLPNQPTSLLAYMLDYLTENPQPHPVPILLNSIDSAQLRKPPTPSLLATLAAHPMVSLFCTADTPNFPLLWDVGLKAQYKFLFHDATTFAPYDAEIDVVESVNELLGRSGRRVGGRDGVGFVLRSLPENARSLFRILVTEQLGLLLMDEVVDVDQDIDTATTRNKRSVSAKNTTTDSTQGVEYRVLYHKAVEEFVCSSEVGFRTLLKEFHDHQMIESRKDAMGTERLWVPFRQEELEGLAEELSGDAF